MQVGVGVSEAQDSYTAGEEAIKMALAKAKRSDPCDIVLLFATATHHPKELRSAVAAKVGHDVAIVGGGSIGIITNNYYGYAGDQVGVAAIWLDGVGCELYSEGSLVNQEEKIGNRLGKRLAARGTTPDTPSILFYDAVVRTGDSVRLNLATPLLQGLEKGLGFLPSKLVGAGLQGDFDGTPTYQWTGADTAEENAIMLTFSDMEIDSVIMHGCRPAGEYYTVTKSEGQTILEINGQPAVPFIESQLTPSLPAEAFPFFMIFGINRDPEGKYSEKNYANRLCLDIDKARNGIVMFESDMVPGTKFQIMYRSLDLDYIPPRIEHIFNRQAGRRPVFALYIDCAGRAARYSTDLEDAVVVQRAVNNRVPLLGLYTGVEIAPIMNRPRTLDWTGVFCLFSVPAE